MMKAMAEKFEFDSFSDQAASPRRRKEQIALEEQVARAREEARSQGFEEGLAKARETDEARAARLLEDLGHQAVALVSEIKNHKHQIEAQSVELAHLIAKKLAGAAIDQFPGAGAEAIIRDCLDDLREESRLVIRLSEQDAELLESRLDSLSQKAGYQGALIMLAEPDLAPGSLRIEWADGGVERSTGEVEAAIEQKIAALTGGENTGEDTLTEAKDRTDD